MYSYLMPKYSTYWGALLLCWFVQVALAQDEQLIEFDTGKTAISLAQVATIQAFAKQLGSNPKEKIVVYAYASDAQGNDTNNRLARRRSYLIQQCLERAGVPLSRLHLRHFTCGPDELGCPLGARIWIERNRALEATNAYQDRNREYIWDQLADAYEEQFTIDPKRDTFLVLQKRGMVFVPRGSFAIDQPLPIVLTIRHLERGLDQWLHGVEGHIGMSRGRDGRELFHVQATQNGQRLPQNLLRPMSILLWNRRGEQVLPTPRWYEQGTWKAATTQVPKLQLLGVRAEAKMGEWCEKDFGAIELPDFATPPERPAYEHPDSVTALQDAAIAALGARLEALEALRYSKNGKKEVWTPQQKQRAYRLTNQRAKLLVQREERRRKVVLKNAALEEAYYRAVAVYNQNRHQQQRQLLTQQSVQEQEVAQQATQCTSHKARQAYLRLVYTTAQLKQLQARMEQQSFFDGAREHYWIMFTKQGTWGFGTEEEQPNKLSTVNLRVKTPISAYKVTAALELSGRIILGEPIDATTLEFKGITPLVQRGQLWAVAEGIDGYEVATMIVPLTQKTPFPMLSFESIPFKDALLSSQPVEPK